ncbi:MULTISPECIES: polyphenol oxidase family protein [Arthrobacter]|uniref:polyphenol oxidase family protein n=1 Tax=Arthrobacter TaxID=1663 RepID=UPI0028F6E9ED|nr:polyphenol oxidase family protein [Arthrobacter sp. lap29]
MFSHQEVRPGIWVGFTGTETGNLAFHVGDDGGAVARRRAALNAALSEAVGTDVALAYMNQVHGNAVAILSAGAAAGKPAPTADAMVTWGTAGAGVAVMVADCVPVVLVGETLDGGVLLAVAHAGRPGVERDVIGAVVSAMRAAGADAIEAWLGPSICGYCYEVPDQMRQSVAVKEPESFATTSWGTPSLDLPAAVLAQLRSNHVTAHPSGECTLENHAFHSHRRAIRDGSAEGRFIGFAVSAR